MTKKWYVGRKNGVRAPFQCEYTPTSATHGDRFAAVIGPFRTKRGATFHAAVGANNPHIQNVNDAERIAKAQA